MTAPRSTTVLTRHAVFAGVMAAVLLLVAGCSSSDSSTPRVPPSTVSPWLIDSADGSTGDPAGPDESSDAPPPKYQQDIVVNPGTQTFEGAISDITDLVCESPGDVGRASGTVTNSADGPRAYRIYVAYLLADGDTVGLSQVDVDTLSPSASSSWASELAIPGANELRCVLRVERFSPTSS